MKLFSVFVLTLIVSCESKTDSPKENSDQRGFEEVHENYRKFWFENDSTKVVSLFAEDGAIIPPGNKGDIVKGRKAIGAWWFTANGDTTYPITSFAFKNGSFTSSANLAIWEGISEVGWNTVVKDSVLSSQTSTTNVITVFKKENNSWKIFRQIWNVKPAK